VQAAHPRADGEGRTRGPGQRVRAQAGDRLGRPGSAPSSCTPARAGDSVNNQRNRNWLANLAAEPQFTFHLKHGIVADLPATAAVIVDPAERRRVLAVFVEEFNRRHGPDSPRPEAVLDEWVERSPLAKVTFVDTD
jgi:hypothetical protein